MGPDSRTVNTRYGQTSGLKGRRMANASFRRLGAWVTNAPESARVKKENSITWCRSQLNDTSPRNRSANWKRVKSVQNHTPTLSFSVSPLHLAVGVQYRQCTSHCHSGLYAVFPVCDLAPPRTRTRNSCVWPTPAIADGLDHRWHSPPSGKWNSHRSHSHFQWNRTVSRSWRHFDCHNWSKTKVVTNRKSLIISHNRIDYPIEGLLHGIRAQSVHVPWSSRRHSMRWAKVAPYWALNCLHRTNSPDSTGPCRSAPLDCSKYGNFKAAKQIE